MEPLEKIKLTLYSTAVGTILVCALTILTTTPCSAALDGSETKSQMFYYFMLCMFQCVLLSGLSNENMKWLYASFGLGHITFLIYLSGTLQATLEDIVAKTSWTFYGLVILYGFLFALTLVYLNMINYFVDAIEKKQLKEQTAGGYAVIPPVEAFYGDHSRNFLETMVELMFPD